MPMRGLQPCGCQSWFDQSASSSGYALWTFDQGVGGDSIHSRCDSTSVPVHSRQTRSHPAARTECRMSSLSTPCPGYSRSYGPRQAGPTLGPHSLTLPPLSLSLYLALSLSLSFTHTLSLSLSLTHSLTLSLPLSLTHTPPTLSLPLSHTYTHSGRSLARQRHGLVGERKRRGGRRAEGEGRREEAPEKGRSG